MSRLGLFRQLLSIFILLVLALGVSSCSIPQDQGNTLARARDGVLRVGVAPSAPWVRQDEEGDPAGVEVALVQALAGEINAEIVWVAGAESELLAALSRHELDLVVGGLTAASPALVHVGVTYPYYSEQVSVGVSEPGKTFRNLEGREIAVEMGSEIAAILLAEGAVPRRLRDLSPTDAPLAAPEWRLAAWNLTSTGIHLRRADHVFAVPPGENGWLHYVDQFLAGREDEAASLLRQEAEPR